MLYFQLESHTFICDVYTASVTGNRKMAESMIRAGADINTRDKDGKTALMIAVVNGHQDLVDILLEKDADLYIKNEVLWICLPY